MITDKKEIVSLKINKGERMKKKSYVILLLFFFTKQVIFGQEDLKVIKLDNSNYPQIELFLRAEQSVNLKKITISENNRPIEAKIDTVRQEKITSGLSILFVLNVDAEKETRETLIEKIQELNDLDKINIGFFLNSDTTETTIHFLSPELSTNHFFFINALKNRKFDEINYTLDRKEKKTAKKSFEKMSALSETFTKKGVFFITNTLNFKKESVTSFFVNPSNPTYITLTKSEDNQRKKKFIDICTQTGGIFTETEGDIGKTINRYIEDISLQTNTQKTKVLRITFITKQNNEQNIIRINYLNRAIEYVFNKPDNRGFNKTEKYLLALSVLLLFLLLTSLRKRKNQQRKAKQTVQKLKNASKNRMFPTKPIEINVKTKGFNKTYFFEKHIISIGRSSTNDIIIPDRTVSGSHALINKEGESFKIQDLNSTNGVVVNQKKVKNQKLVSKDKIKLGAAILTVRL